MNDKAPERARPDRRRAAKAARIVAAEVGLDAAPRLALEIVAHARGALVRTSNATTGAAARLVSVAARAEIAVSPKLSRVQRRFAIAHEIGHLELHAADSFIGLCTEATEARVYHESPLEEEADAFAAELLLPRRLLLPRCDEIVAWGTASAIARTFEVSITAAAMRFVELTQQRAAIVCTRDGRVQWSRRSFRFGYRIARGHAVGATSVARRAERSWDRSPSYVPLGAWIDGAGDDAHVLEHAFAMPRVGVVMSLLAIE